MSKSSKLHPKPPVNIIMVNKAHSSHFLCVCVYGFESVLISGDCLGKSLQLSWQFWTWLALPSLQG